MPDRLLKRIPLAVLTLFAIINIARGCIHLFAEDGGASSIAGLDLSTNPQTILALFAVVGASQLATGVVETWVVLNGRKYLLFMLSLQTLMTSFAVLNMYLWRNFPVEVPGKTFNTVLLFVLIATVILAARQKKSAR